MEELLKNLKGGRCLRINPRVVVCLRDGIYNLYWERPEEIEWYQFLDPVYIIDFLKSNGLKIESATN